MQRWKLKNLQVLKKENWILRNLMDLLMKKCQRTITITTTTTTATTDTNTKLPHRWVLEIILRHTTFGRIPLDE